MLFVECSSTSGGQEFESTFSTAVCKIQLCAKYSSRMCYIESTLIIPSVPKEKKLLLSMEAKGLFAQLPFDCAFVLWK